MAITSSYECRVNCTFLCDGKETPITNEGITNIIINCDYDEKILPTVYVGVRLETYLYDKMVENQENARIILKVSRSNKTRGIGFFEDYINDEFVYSMTTDYNYETELEKLSGTENAIGQNFKEGYISLFQLDNIDNNKYMANTIIKNSNMASIIHKHMAHMKVVMEPLHYDKYFKHLIIPPLESVSKLLNYLNKQSLFYRGGYRYFIDFDRAYLLSDEGNYVNDGTGDFGNVIIHVQDPVNEISNQVGITTDGKAEAYILNVNALNTIMNIKTSEDKIFNTVIGVDSDGNTKSLRLDIPRTSNSSDKPRLERVPADNINYTDYLKSQIEHESIYLSMEKTEVNGSLITPNKVYSVHNYKAFAKYDGRFVLSSKKEVLMNQNNIFIGSVIFTLRKIKNR